MTIAVGDTRVFGKALYGKEPGSEDFTLAMLFHTDEQQANWYLFDLNDPDWNLQRKPVSMRELWVWILRCSDDAEQANKARRFALKKTRAFMERQPLHGVKRLNLQQDIESVEHLRFATSIDPEILLAEALSDAVPR